jgi:hypothetical protein
MDDALDDPADDDARWVASARHLTPLPPPPRRRKARKRLRAAQRAMVFGVLGIVCFGLFFGPLALRWGQTARLAVVEDDDPRDVGLAHAAVTLGKAGFAIHLAVIMASLPWLLFMLPFVFGG